LLDGQNVSRENLQDYRELFSAVFGDFHLSRHLDGVDDNALHETDFWMKTLEIQGKVRIENKAFSTTELSTGQRKRLALVATVLEQRPILVLDEWAADQDPIFRKKFYREILPMLRDRGWTIIAVTHDSRVFDSADMQMHMEEGKMTEFDPELFHD